MHITKDNQNKIKHNMLASLFAVFHFYIHVRVIRFLSLILLFSTRPALNNLHFRAIILDYFAFPENSTTVKPAQIDRATQYDRTYDSIAINRTASTNAFLDSTKDSCFCITKYGKDLIIG